MKQLGRALVALTLLLIVAAPAYADNGNKDGKGDDAPEAAMVLLLPAAGAGAVGLRMMFKRGKRLE